MLFRMRDDRDLITIVRQMLSRVLVLGYLTFSGYSLASFEAAMEIYSAGKFDEAKDAFETMAAIGDPSALFNLGVMHFRGEAVEKDPVRAYVLVKIANEGVVGNEFGKTADAIYARLDETQKEAAVELYPTLLTVYGRESISANIIPKLLDDEDCLPEAKPVHRAPPLYPRTEQSSGKMGVVHLEFTISPEGYAREVIVAASTNRNFAVSARKAASNYIYEPPGNGNPKEHRLSVIFQMELTDQSIIRSAPFVREIESLEEKASEGDPVSQFMLARSLNTYKQFEDYLPERSFQYREANEWYTKSAKAGLTYAQFEIGRNMMEGRGCEVDRENGFKWIQAAAVGGHSRAQKYLANAEITGQAEVANKTQSTLSWLRNASRDEVYGYPSKLLLAWELVTSAEKDIWDPDEALKLIKDDPYTFQDDIRVFETQAAAWALKENFKKALKFQRKAAKLAEKKGWDIPKINERLALYENNQFYLGSYY